MWSKSGNRPVNIPSLPSSVYQEKGWTDWPDWLGYKPKTQRYWARRCSFLPFISARVIARRLKLKSVRGWKQWSNKSGERPSNIPGSPYNAYRGAGWVSWQDWLGYDRSKMLTKKASASRKRKRESPLLHPAEGVGAAASAAEGEEVECCICFDPLSNVRKLQLRRLECKPQHNGRRLAEEERRPEDERGVHHAVAQLPPHRHGAPQPPTDADADGAHLEWARGIAESFRNGCQAEVSRVLANEQKQITMD